MEQLINDFISYMRDVKDASENTLQAYMNDLKKLYSFCIRQDIQSVTKISETNLKSYLLALENEGLSPSSINRNIAAVKAFILYLIKHQIIFNDPSERIKPPPVRKKAPQVLDTQMINRLLEQPDTKSHKGIRDKAILELLYATGIKVSELISIRLSDVNMSARYIICREFRERIIPFGNSAKKALQDYLNIRSKYYDKSKSDILFLNSSGKAISRQGLWKIIKYYADTAGITDVNPNSIRHSFAAHMLDNGADLGSVQEFLGHSDISTTQIYMSSGYKNSREVYMRTHPRA
ncbi:MAG: tyrosine recombinase [Clostridiales bacterium]|nr:tyrosine recombinase [Clostridiales bacterium]